MLELFESQRRLSLVELPEYLPRTDPEALYGAVAGLLHEGRLDAALDERPFVPQSPIRARAQARA